MTTEQTPFIYEDHEMQQKATGNIQFKDLF